MRRAGRLLVALLALGALRAAGCDCSGEDLSGVPDAHVTDTPLEEPAGEPDAPCIDLDGDGHPDEACGGDDCDDTDPDVHPGAGEVCADGVDQDCDGIVDGLGTVWTSERLEGSGPESHAGFLFWTGSEYLLGWLPGDGFSWYIDRVAPSGDVAGHAPILPGVTVPDSLQAAYAGGPVAITWVENLYVGTSRMMFSIVGPDGATLLDPVVLVDDGTARDQQAMAWIGSETIVVWTSSRPGMKDLVLTRVDGAGHRIADDLILSAGDRMDHVPPSLTWTGSRLGVVWASYENFGLWDWEDTEVLFNAYDPGAGAAGGMVNVSFAESASNNPHLLWTGSEMSIAWRDRRSSDSEVFFVRTDDAGASLMEEVGLEGAGDWVFEPIRHVWTGSEFVVAWNDSLSGYEEIALHRLDPAGVPLGELVRADTVEWSSSLREMVWTGSEIGIVTRDGMYENEGLYLTRIAYCE